ncbi:ABC transporter substrate-binding protein [Cohnella fermenti]|uniref:Extracellular solute-binding protein n=1 Tax=Cohnella fermenti TaxID=2565925 RepID=A0A4S4BS36_9BACL|nr:extracellular solute-binding protein [Cohnella fermenti]THF77286.1 extracellular solute-binding protein [Cohnella fermenti]
MRQITKWGKALGIGVLAGSVLAGCAANEDGGNAANGSGNGTASDGETKNVTLRFSWWGSEARHKAVLEAIDLYMEQNPNVTIEPEYGGFDGYYQKLVTQLSGHTAPDLTPLSADWIDDIAVKGNLVLDLYTLKDQINLEAFDQSFLEKYVVYDGKMIGLPMGVNGMVTAYNKDFLQKYGIPEDTQWDWNTIHDIGQQVHQQDSSVYLLGTLDFRTFLQPYMSQKTGNQWINDDKTIGFTEADLTEAFAYYKSLFDDGVMQPAAESSLYSEPAKNVLFQKGGIGLAFSLASALPQMKTYVPSLDVASYPIAADAKTSGVLVVPANPLAINKDTKYPEEAAKFASWLLTAPESAAILRDNFSVPPAAANAQSLADQNLIDPTVAKAVQTALQDPGDPINGVSNNQEIAKLVNDYMQQVAFGQSAPDKAAKELIERMKDKLASLQ